MLLVHPIRGIGRRVVAVAVAPFASRSTVIISRHGRLILNPPASIIQSRPTMGASCQESQSRSRSWSWLESRAGVRGAGHVWQPRVRFKVEVWKRKRKRKRCGSRSGDHTLSRHQAANSRERCNAIAGPVVSVRAKGSGAAIIAVGLGRGCASDAPSGEGLGNNGGGLEDEGTDVARKGSEWLAQSVQVGASRAVQVGRCESSPAVAAVQLWPLCSLGALSVSVRSIER